jgi:hypothetical protein
MPQGSQAAVSGLRHVAPPHVQTTVALKTLTRSRKSTKEIEQFLILSLDFLHLQKLNSTRAQEAITGMKK